MNKINLRSFAFAFSISLVAPGIASAGFYDGNKLYRECQVELRSLLLGFVIGVHDAVTETSVAFLANGGVARKKVDICTPQNATAGQLMDTVCIFLRETPQDRHQEASFLVQRALAKAYPCQ